MICTHTVTSALLSIMLEAFICICCLGVNITVWFPQSVSTSPLALCTFWSGSSVQKLSVCPSYSCGLFHEGISGQLVMVHGGSSRLAAPLGTERAASPVQMELQGELRQAESTRLGVGLGHVAVRKTLWASLIARMVRTMILALQMKDDVLYFLTPFHRLSSDS